MVEPSSQLTLFAVSAEIPNFSQDPDLKMTHLVSP